VNWWIDSTPYPGPREELSRPLNILDDTYTRTVGVGGKQISFKSLDCAVAGDHVTVLSEGLTIFEGYVHSWEGQVFGDRPIEYDFTVTEKQPMPILGSWLV